MKKENVSMPIVHANASGIDVGSRSHFVAIGQGSEEVREFGVYTEELESLVDWLLENKIRTVALESTGDYWQNLYSELLKKGLDVYLVNGKYTKNASRKKTDVLDCQWIQKLHSLGLLNRSFLPDSKTEELRTYCRQRLNLISDKSKSSLRMQKFLKLLNYRLDVVVNDITGLTGLKIIKAICGGERDPKKLAKHRHYNCRKSEEEIAKALVSNGRSDYIFGLQQELRKYTFTVEEIAICDKAIGKLLERQIEEKETMLEELPAAKKYKRKNKNSLQTVDLNVVSYQYFNGVDLLAIPGVSYSTVLSIMSEIGPDGLKNFPSSKHFTSWLRLAPNNKISGGRRISSRVPRGSNRLKIALRNAAYSISRLKEGDLSRFYRKMVFRKGSTKAITAVARKLATIIWNMVVHRVPYKSREEYLFLDQKRKQIAELRKKISKFGINPNDLGLFRMERDRLAYEKRGSDNQGVS